MPEHQEIKSTDLSVVQIQYTTLYDYIRHLGFTEDNEIRRSLLQMNPHLIQDSRLVPMVYTLQAKSCSLNGNSLKAFKGFKTAEKLALDSCLSKDIPEIHEVLAYVKFEFAVFYRSLGEIDLADNLLRGARSHAHGDAVIRSIDYQLALIRYEQNGGENFSEINEMLSNFLNNHVFATYVLGKFYLGEIHRKKKDFTASETYLKEAHDLAIQYNYGYIQYLIKNSIGLLMMAREQYDEALSCFESIRNFTNGFFILSLANENIAAVYYHLGQYDSAVTYCYAALNISIDNDVLTRVPGQAVFLGDMYRRKLNQPEKARFFYRLAFEKSLSYSELGLPLSGQRLIAVKRYMRFLESHTGLQLNSAGKPGVFEFTAGKTWQEISDIFKYNLICFYKLRCSTRSDVVKGLKMTASAYASNHTRLALKGFILPALKQSSEQSTQPNYRMELQEFIAGMKDRSWTSAVETFEKEVLETLFEKYRNNKSRLSGALKFSYPNLLKKLKHYEIQTPRFIDE